MIDSGQQDDLVELDNARKIAREAISISNEPVAYQYRFKPKESSEWSLWIDCGPGNRAPVR